MFKTYEVYVNIRLNLMNSQCPFYQKFTERFIMSEFY